MFGYDNVSMQIKVPYFKSKFCNVLFTAEEHIYMFCLYRLYPKTINDGVCF